MEQKALDILIVDDNQQDCLYLQKVIDSTTSTTNVIIANTIAEAIGLCNNHNFDCIFLDYNLPHLNGHDFLTAHALKRGKANIVVISSEESVELAVECMKLGACDFINKSKVAKATIETCLNYIVKLNKIQTFSAITEKSLVESELRLNNIISKSPVILFNINNNKVITLFKGKGIDRLKIKTERIIGRKLDQVTDLSPIKESDYQAAFSGSDFQFTVEVENSYFDVTYIPVYNEDKSIINMMGVAIDVTEYKNSEEELKNKILKTGQSAKSKEEFLANISHEIRTPIHGIISLSQFLNSTSLNNEQNKYLELIRKSANTLLVIVNDILDLSKIDAGHMTFEDIDFNTKDIIQSSIAAFIPKSNEKGIYIKTTINNNVPECIKGDPVRLTQVVNNILGNAVKFTNLGGIDISVDCYDRTSKYVMLEIRIKDTGIGIPAHKIKTIFNTFSQASLDITRKYGGTGLGLNITKQLVEKQNGSIYVDSALDKGTLFTIKIPYKISEISSTQVTNDSKVADGIPVQIKVLVAEDHDINRFIIEKILKDWNYEYDFAMNGEDAVAYASKKQYDLILMDIEMPDIDGYKATSLIRNSNGLNSITPIIAITGHAMNGEREKCIASGMNDYISKPFKTGELQQLIKKLIVEVTNQSNLKEGQTMQSTTSDRFTDMHFLRELSDDNEQFYKDFLIMFLTNTPIAINAIKNAFVNDDWENLKLAAHKVKPSFNYVGLKELNALAAKIESQAKEKNPENIPAMITRIEEVMAYAIKELESELNTIIH
jgi:signal transduction histidine kinase/DNA-binding response OmpR family regulator